VWCSLLPGENCGAESCLVYRVLTWLPGVPYGAKCYLVYNVVLSGSCFTL
jgi:hypothetical protein